MFLLLFSFQSLLMINCEHLFLGRQNLNLEQNNSRCSSHDLKTQNLISSFVRYQSRIRNCQSRSIHWEQSLSKNQALTKRPRYIIQVRCVPWAKQPQWFDSRTNATGTFARPLLRRCCKGAASVTEIIVFMSKVNIPWAQVGIASPFYVVWIKWGTAVNAAATRQSISKPELTISSGLSAICPKFQDWVLSLRCIYRRQCQNLTRRKNNLENTTYGSIPP